MNEVPATASASYVNQSNIEQSYTGYSYGVTQVSDEPRVHARPRYAQNPCEPQSPNTLLTAEEGRELCLDSQVAGNNPPPYPKVDLSWFKVEAHNYDPLALQVESTRKHGVMLPLQGDMDSPKALTTKKPRTSFSSATYIYIYIYIETFIYVCITCRSFRP